MFICGLKRVTTSLFTGACLLLAATPAEAGPGITTLDVTGWQGGLGLGVSNNGTVVGEVDLGTGIFGAYWSSTGTQFGIPSSLTDRVRALGISADGSTIVGNDIVGANQVPISLTGAGYTTRTDLGSLGGTMGFANATNSDGSIIVGQSYLADNTTNDQSGVIQ